MPDVETSADRFRKAQRAAKVEYDLIAEERNDMKAHLYLRDRSISRLAQEKKELTEQVEILKEQVTKLERERDKLSHLLYGEPSGQSV